MSLLNCKAENNMPQQIIKKKIVFIMLFFSCFFKNFSTLCRSVLRGENNKKPQIQVRLASKKSRNYYLKDWRLEKDPIFGSFDKKFFNKNLVPDKISYKYSPNNQVTKKMLVTKLEHLFQEIEKKKRHYTHFDVLRKSNFNRRKRCGLLILKFKDYPFVVKIFMETPRSFVRPYSKGFYPIFFYNMGGGINRHLLGFTRVNNLLEIKDSIEKSPKWSKMISTPRKWFWKPQDSNDIEIIGKNFGNKEIKVIIPGTYCIIADAIKLKNKHFSLFDQPAREMCMSLCNYLDVRIDPHIDNFLLEEGTDKIVIIDTEHFPSIVGFKKRQQFNGYFDWYFKLCMKCLNDMFFTSKKERIKRT